MKATRPQQSEHEIQKQILGVLGTPQYISKTDKRGISARRMTGLYVGERSMFWRANTGAASTASGGFVRYGVPGQADILGVVEGVPVAIEVKREGGKQSAEQKEWQAIFEKAGGYYCVVFSVAEAMYFVEEIRRMYGNE